MRFTPQLLTPAFFVLTLVLTSASAQLCETNQSCDAHYFCNADKECQELTARLAGAILVVVIIVPTLLITCLSISLCFCLKCCCFKSRGAAKADEEQPVPPHSYPNTAPVHDPNFYPPQAEPVYVSHAQTHAPPPPPQQHGAFAPWTHVNHAPYGVPPPPPPPPPGY